MNKTGNIIVFSIDEQKYALHLSCIEKAIRIVEINPMPKAPDSVLGVINVQGRLIPVMDTRRLLHLPGKELGLSDQLIIARISGRTVALVVDAVVNVIDLPEHETVPSEDIFPGMDHVSGVLKLEDDMIYIYDPDRLFSPEDETLTDLAMEKA
jgi:purine-binding chemotaxis protein CheW